VIRLALNDAESVRAVTERVDPAVAARTIIVIDSRGGVRTGAQAIFTVVAATGGISGLLARVFAVRPISLLLEPGYRLFSRHRGRFTRFFPDP
jgi:predicted DCC family thiol-disulfide oxidoreductase YuxK